MSRQWTETTIENDDDLMAFADAANEGETFAFWEGFHWLVFWNEQGDEWWLRAATEDDGTQHAMGVYQDAEDVSYPYTYLHTKHHSANGPV